MLLGKKILIADDHTIVSRGLTYLISLNFEGYTIDEVTSLEALMKRLEKTEYDFLILDLNLEDGNSIEYIPTIVKKYPTVSILIHSMMSEDIYAKKLLPLGIAGYLKKNSSERETLNALDALFSGEKYLSKNLKASLFNKNYTPSENIFEKLSITELKVLGMLMKGFRVKEIAGEMDVAQQTIATYKTRIFKKLDTDNIFELKRLSELYNISFD